MSRDQVKRPDAYLCTTCKSRFNEGKKVFSEEGGIHNMIVVCPDCGSTEIIITWWKKEQEQIS